MPALIWKQVSDGPLPRPVCQPSTPSPALRTIFRLSNIRKITFRFWGAMATALRGHANRRRPNHAHAKPWAWHPEPAGQTANADGKRLNRAGQRYQTGQSADRRRSERLNWQTSGSRRQRRNIMNAFGRLWLASCVAAFLCLGAVAVQTFGQPPNGKDAQSPSRSGQRSASGRGQAPRWTWRTAPGRTRRPPSRRPRRSSSRWPRRSSSRWAASGRRKAWSAAARIPTMPRKVGRDRCPETKRESGLHGPDARQGPAGISHLLQGADHGPRILGGHQLRSHHRQVRNCRLLHQEAART